MSTAANTQQRTVDPTQAAADETQLLKRIELRVTESFYDALSLLAADENTNKADVIRKAVTFYARAKVNQRDRKLLATVSVDDNNQMKIEEVVQLWMKIACDSQNSKLHLSQADAIK